MRVLAACSLGGSGHLNPLVPFLDAARHRGDDVLVVGPPALQGLIGATGHPFAAGGEPDETEVAPIRERLATAPALEASVLGNRELFGRLATAAMLPAMEQVCAEWQPDLVLRDPCEYSSAIVAARLGITTAQVAISLAEAERGSIAVAAPALDAHRAGLVDELLAEPYLTRMPEPLDPSPFPRTRRYREAQATTPGELPDWWAGRDGPLVYLTFGTVLGHMSMAPEIYRMALDAVAGIRARVLMTIGRQLDRSTIGAVPANVHVESWVEQRDVLAGADLVVCHGGSGTAYGALAAGVPMVLVPIFADQFENSRRIADQGAGLVVETGRTTAGGERVVIGMGDGDTERVTAAISTVLADPSFELRARKLAAQIAGTPTVAELLDALLG